MRCSQRLGNMAWGFLLPMSMTGLSSKEAWRYQEGREGLRSTLLGRARVYVLCAGGTCTTVVTPTDIAFLPKALPRFALKYEETRS